MGANWWPSSARAVARYKCLVSSTLERKGHILSVQGQGSSTRTFYIVLREEFCFDLGPGSLSRQQNEPRTCGLTLRLKKCKRAGPSAALSANKPRPCNILRALAYQP